MSTLLVAASVMSDWNMARKTGDREDSMNWWHSNTRSPHATFTSEKSLLLKATSRSEDSWGGGCGEKEIKCF